MLRPSDYMRDITPELVRLMHTSRTPVILVGAALFLVTATNASIQGDAVSAGFAALSACVTAVRVVVADAFQRAWAATMSPVQAAVWERRYAAAGLPFAFLAGGYAAYALLALDATAQMLALAVAFGYAAGMIVRVSVRPRVARMLLVVALLPPAVAAAMVPTAERVVLLIITTAYLAAGLEFIRYLYATIVDRVRLQGELARLALHDDLTGLANRRYLKDHLHDIAEAGDEHAILLVDLDRFKAVNDAHGHDVGDAVLCEVARRLESISHPSDLVVRLGGDEFAVVRRGFAANRAPQLARAIVTAMSTPVITDAATVIVGASVGVSEGNLGDARDDLPELLSKADEALFEAKDSGRGRFAVAG